MFMLDCDDIHQERYSFMTHILSASLLSPYQGGHNTLDLLFCFWDLDEQQTPASVVLVSRTNRDRNKPQYCLSGPLP